MELLNFTSGVYSFCLSTYISETPEVQLEVPDGGGIKELFYTCASEILDIQNLSTLCKIHIKSQSIGSGKEFQCDSSLDTTSQ